MIVVTSEAVRVTLAVVMLVNIVRILTSRESADTMVINEVTSVTKSADVMAVPPVVSVVVARVKI